MSIDSVTQAAASSYIAQQTGANASAAKEASNTGFQRMVDDVVEISDEAKTAYAASSNSNPRGSLLTAWLNSSTGKADLSNMPISPPEGVKINFDGHSTFTEMMDARVKAEFGFDTYAEYIADSRLKGEYGTAKHDFDTANHKESQAAYEALLDSSGGLLYGVSYEPENLSKPIKTLAGRIHPQSDAIRSFLTAHKSEFDQVKQIQNRQFMSFDEWKLEQEA